jgi:hypothetical protein
VVQYDISILVVVVVVVVVVAFDDRLIKSALNIIDVQRGLLRRVLIEIGYFHIVGRLWDAWDTRLPLAVRICDTTADTAKVETTLNYTVLLVSHGNRERGPH